MSTIANALGRVRWKTRISRRGCAFGLVVAVLGLAGFLRFYHLDGYGLWSDEFVTLLIASSRSWQDLIRTCFEIPQPMPPLYFLLTRGVVSWLGPSEVSLRVISAASSLGVVGLVFAIGRRLFSVEAGLFGALFCAVNSTQIVYAQNSRPYAFCLFLSCLSIISFLKWLDRPGLAKGTGFVACTVLLFYTHYIFFPLILVLNLYFLWRARTEPALRREEKPSPGWRGWVMLQACVGLLLLPLVPQLWKIVQTRDSLNWYKEYPSFTDLFVFFNGTTILRALAASLCLWGVAHFAQGLWHPGNARTLAEFPSAASSHVIYPRGPIVFLMLWYMVPVGLFFLFARGLGINLFVERYLILSSLPVYLLVAVIPLIIVSRSLACVFLVIYLLLYSSAEPVMFFRQKGEFSQGVPGANEWRESLGELEKTAYDAPLFLFQSPFIESNQLSFEGDPKLSRYLSAPLWSFYVIPKRHDCVLMPVHWWINNEAHLRFKGRTRDLLGSHRDFVLLSTQEFWDNFFPWLDREFSGNWRIVVVRHFDSTGALRLKRIQLVPLTLGSEGKPESIASLP